MSTVPPPATQTPQPQPAAAQAVPRAVVRDPSVEVLRLATGTRLEGTVVAPPSQATSVDAARVAAQAAQVQATQAAVDANRADLTRAANTQAQTVDTRQAQPADPRQAQPAQITQPQIVQVRTPVGDITLRTPLPLPEGARVTLEVATSSNTQVSVRFAAVNGQPVQQALAQLAAERAAQPPPTETGARPTPAQLTSPAALTFGQIATPLGPVALTQAGPLNAFVINGTTPLATALSAQLGQPTGLVMPGQTVPGQATPGQIALGQPGQAATPGAALPGGTPTATTPAATALQIGLVTGSDITLRVTGLTPGQPGATPPQAGGIATTSAGPPTNAAGVTRHTPIPGQTTTGTGQAPTSALTQQSPQGPNALLPGGGSAQSGLRLVGAQGWPPTPFAPPSQGQSSPLQLTLTGAVTSLSSAGQPSVQTALGTVQLANAANLPVGTTVTFEVISQTLPRGEPTGVNAPPPAPGGLPFASGVTPWPTLTEALQLMQRIDPQAAQLLANTIPDGGPRTVVAALSFVQAMRSGEPRQWPGDNNLRALERTGPRGAHLAKSIAGEVSQLSAQSRDTGGEWRATPIPWNAEGQIEKIRLITRREDTEDDEKEDKKRSGIRFLLELDLSKMGPLQLDGMVREDVNGFDLVIRSHETLADQVRRDLTGLFIAANQAVGLKGVLTFQVTPKFPDPISQSGPFKQQRDGVWA